MSDIQVPVLSLARLEADAAEREHLAAACREWGFFLLTEHGVSEEAQQRFMFETKRFFACPSDEKRKITRTAENPWGFYDQELTKNRRDWKEIFDFGRDQDHATWDSRSQWPELVGFREVMMDWFSTCEDLSRRLLSQVTLTLGDDSTLLTRHFAPVHSSFLRLNYYPVCDDPADGSLSRPAEGHLGISHHTDAGAVTVLFQDAVPGLQVEHDGRWFTIDPIPGAFIINIGDMVEVWSNGRYRAPLHRVLANDSDERFSAPFFYNPAFDTNVAPITDEQARFRTINWGEFRAARAAGDYADEGQEIQIADFAC